MSTTATMGEFAGGPPPHDAEVAPGVLRKVLTASFIGNFVEWFDYASYGYFATVIAHAFFPEIAPTAALTRSRRARSLRRTAARAPSAWTGV